jgi:4-diphosphocytidyl-2-C-methyl-D-erythritol kinase
MLEAGALGVLVSGSGPTLLGLARDAAHARRIAAEVAEHFDAVEVATSPAGGPEFLPAGPG